MLARTFRRTLTIVSACVHCAWAWAQVSVVVPATSAVQPAAEDNPFKNNAHLRN